MATFLLRFGSYTFPNTFTYTDINNSFASIDTKTPYGHGSNIVSKFLNGKKVSVTGLLLANNLASSSVSVSLRQQLDNMKAALIVGPADLYLATDRILKDSFALSFPESYDESSPERYAKVKIDFSSKNAFYMEAGQQVSSTNPIASSPYTITETAGGNFNALPLIALTIGSVGSLIATVTNSATGETFTLKGIVSAGMVISIDSYALTVTTVISGTIIDRIDLFDGVFPYMIPGANPYHIVFSGASITNVSFVWNNRWV